MEDFEKKQIARALRAFATSIEQGNEYGEKMGWSPEYLRMLAWKQSNNRLQADDARLCGNCGEPMMYHIGGAKRGLCKNRIAAKA
jgi:hypothetical protein